MLAQQIILETDFQQTRPALQLCLSEINQFATHFFEKIQF